MDLFTQLEASPAGVPRDIAELFEKIALQLVDEGFQRFSADAILHQIRWTHRIEWISGEWKCNDHWTSALARWFLARHPRLRAQKFFELRSTRQEQAA